LQAAISGLLSMPKLVSWIWCRRYAISPISARGRAHRWVTTRPLALVGDIAICRHLLHETSFGIDSKPEIAAATGAV